MVARNPTSIETAADGERPEQVQHNFRPQKRFWLRIVWRLVVPVAPRAKTSPPLRLFEHFRTVSKGERSRRNRLHATLHQGKAFVLAVAFCLFLSVPPALAG
jgi:hypothetical protein